MSDNTDFLNLDDLAVESRVVQNDGIKYHMRDMTVEDFIEMGKREKDAVEFDAMNPSEQMEFLVTQIAQAFNDWPESALRELPLRKLNAILEFVYQSRDAEAEEVAQTAETAEGAELADGAEEPTQGNG